MRLITSNSKHRSKNLKDAVEKLGGNSDSAFMFAWMSDMDNYSACIVEMQNALMGVTGYSENEIEYQDVTPKTLKTMGWDIQGAKWLDTAVFVFVKR